MRVPPEPIGAAALDINKSVWWVPLGNLTLPADWDPTEFQAIIDKCPRGTSQLRQALGLQSGAMAV